VCVCVCVSVLWPMSIGSIPDRGQRILLFSGVQTGFGAYPGLYLMATPGLFFLW
jgi:hypothetical protein